MADPLRSRLRPTPETGTVAATQQPAQSFGPSWRDRAGRSARLAYRDALRRGDREGAMSIASAADKEGLASQATIGSAEGRMEGEYLDRQAADRKLGEQQAALDTPVEADAGPQPRSILDKYRGVDAAPGASFTPSAQAPPEPVAPGAREIPTNPVSGATKPPDQEMRRIGIRNSFLDRARAIETETGVLRGDAIRQANAERIAAGQAPIDYDEALDQLLARDRSTSSRPSGPELPQPVAATSPPTTPPLTTPARRLRAATPAIPRQTVPSLPAPPRTLSGDARRVGEVAQAVGRGVVRANVEAARGAAGAVKEQFEGVQTVGRALQSMARRRRDSAAEALRRARDYITN